MIENSEIRETFEKFLGKKAIPKIGKVLFAAEQFYAAAKDVMGDYEESQKEPAPDTGTHTIEIIETLMSGKWCPQGFYNSNNPIPNSDLWRIATYQFIGEYSEVSTTSRKNID